MQGATSGICDSALPGTCGAACEIPLRSLLIVLPRHKTQQQQCKGGQEYLAHGFRSYQSTVTERHGGRAGWSVRNLGFSHLGG